MQALAAVIARDERIPYALVFGSHARGAAHTGSDLEVAIGLRRGASLSLHEVGMLVADLERAAGRRVDLVLLDEAPPAIAYRVFRDGVTLVDREHRALAARKAKAILEYLDFRPLEEIAVRGALAATVRGR